LHITNQHAAGMAAACAHLQQLTLGGQLPECSPSFFSGLAACTQLSHLTVNGSLVLPPYFPPYDEDSAVAALCQMVAGLPALQELSIRYMSAAFFASSPAVLQRITSLTTHLSQGWLQLLGQAASFQRLHTLVVHRTLSIATISSLDSSCPQLKRLTLNMLTHEQDGCTLDSPPCALDTLTVVGFITLDCVLQHRWLVKVGSPASCAHPALHRGSLRLVRMARPACGCGLVAVQVPHLLLHGLQFEDYGAVQPAEAPQWHQAAELLASGPHLVLGAPASSTAAAEHMLTLHDFPSQPGVAEEALMALEPLAQHINSMQCFCISFTPTVLATAPKTLCNLTTLALCLPTSGQVGLCHAA
jgi:hypothetical protein